MAVMFNSLVFGGVNSADYGIYITGEAVYNAPERAVELVSVPGRNGQVAIDQGRWENVEVTYPAGCFGDSQADFAQKISAFRNAIASKIGYQRLTDTYNSDEYRMAMYTAGLEVNAENKWNGTAGEFNITFNCKPQRWLTSGETPVAITSGDELANPTLYESSPMLEVEGYGTIGFNGYEIKLTNDVMGVILIYDQAPRTNDASPDYSQVNPGDALDISNMSSSLVFKVTDSNYVLTGVANDDSTLVISAGSGSASATLIDSKAVKETFVINESTTAYGTAQTLFDGKINAALSLRNVADGTTQTNVYSFHIVVSIRGSGVIHFQISLSTVSGSSIRHLLSGERSRFTVYADSTATLLGHPTYVDCDLGEAYKYSGGEIVSLNRYIDLGSDLPTLGTGANEITYDNTVTELKITPRWWQL